MILPNGLKVIFRTIAGLVACIFLFTSFAVAADAATARLISSVSGSISGGMLGYSVISANNISGDGSSDIIISAPGSSTGKDIGRVYIYFGGNLAKNPDLILTGSAPGGCFGSSIAVGDINGDGYDDIIIGEPYNRENGIKAGKVYVYFGGPSLTNHPNTTMKGRAAGDMFGYSVAACDLNNDKLDDIVVGAPYNSANIGKVYIFYGGQNINTSAGVTLMGAAPGNLFGYSIASANNIDGDNDNGIVVGAPGLLTNTNRSGKAYLYLGGANMNTTAALVLNGENNGDLFGSSVSAGDFNGDGFDDIVVGAEKNSTVAAAAGKACVYFGGRNMTNIPSLTMTGESANDRFGHLVACVGDLNGDGFSDMVIVSPNRNNGAGKAYIYFGELFMDNKAKIAITGEAIGDNFGFSASLAGNINKNGIDGLLIGACNNSSHGIASGKAYLYKIVCSGQPVRTANSLLDDTEAKACKYFYDQTLRTIGANGLVKDTCYTKYSSIAATGFGLSALCIMASRYGNSPYWTVTPAQARDRANIILNTLITIQNSQPGQEDYYGKEGFFFRLIGPDGKRETSVSSEVSTADTALLLAGVITAGKYFGGGIQTKANMIFNAVNWNYFLNAGVGQFYHGWNPDYGLIEQTWDRPSDEILLISLLAIASDPANQDFLKAYYGFPRGKNSYTSAGQTFPVYNSYSGSLFTYILAHCWYDFKSAGPDIPQNVRDARFPVPVDWWENSKTAALANRQFCIDNAAAYSSYGRNDWGLSACFRPDRSYFGMNGAAPREYIPQDGGESANDGTVPSYGAISALPLMKDLETGGLPTNLAYQALGHYYNDYYFRLWGPYGPRDSFNQFKKFSTIYAGTSLGPIALMIENYRSGLLWNIFMADSKIARVRNILSADSTPPAISRFTVNDPSSPTPGYSHSVTVNVCIDGYDAVGIVKWLITETAAQPSAGDFNTNGPDLKPISYTIAGGGDGLKKLYVWAMDKGNNISALTANSQTQIYVDITPPVMGTIVTDGPNATSVSRLHAGWSAQDAQSGVMEYQYSITEGSVTGSVIRDWTSTGTATEVTAENLSLVKSNTYYFNVRAKNGVGLWSAAGTSDGIKFNQSAPSIGSIAPTDGSLAEVGSAIPFNINAVDPEGDAMQYKIVVDGQVVSDWNSASSFSWQTTSQASGIRQATIYVKDAWGNESCSGNISIYLARKALNTP